MPYLGFQRRLVPSVQVSTLTSGSITLPSASRSARATATGYHSQETTFNVMTKLNMNAETLSTVTVSSFSSTETGRAACGDSGVAGYAFGQGTGGVSSQKYLYSTEVGSTLASGLPEFRYYATGGSNSGTAAYITGGATSGFAIRRRTVVKSPFSTDTPATLGSSFTDMGNANGSASNFHTALYTWGGESDTTSRGDWVNKLTFSNDTCTYLVSTLYAKTRSATCLSNDGTALYGLNGIEGGTIAYKMPYATETVSRMAAVSNYSRLYQKVNVLFQINGFFIGGQNYSASDSAMYKGIEKMAFSTDVMSTMSISLSVNAENQFSGEGWSNNGVI
jgi:hypothetical protein